MELPKMTGCVVVAGSNGGAPRGARDCPLVSRLSYVDYSTLPSLGICHIMLNNLVGRFWRIVLAPMNRSKNPDWVVSPRKSRAMTERGAELVMPAGESSCNYVAGRLWCRCTVMAMALNRTEHAHTSWTSAVPTTCRFVHHLCCWHVPGRR